MSRCVVPCVHLVLPQGVPVSQAAQANRRDSRVSAAVCEGPGPCAHVVVPRGIPIPQVDQIGSEGLGCVRGCVGVAVSCAYLVFPWGVPRRQAVHARLEGLGCICHWWEQLDPGHTWFSHEASLSPKRSWQDRRNLGASAAVLERLDPCLHGTPTGCSCPPGGLGRTGGTRMHPPMCASRWMLCIRGPPIGHPYPPSVRGGTGGTRVYPPLRGIG